VPTICNLNKDHFYNGVSVSHALYTGCRCLFRRASPDSYPPGIPRYPLRPLDQEQDHRSDPLIRKISSAVAITDDRHGKTEKQIQFEGGPFENCRESKFLAEMYKLLLQKDLSF
jgi:hypothetical protein